MSNAMRERAIGLGIMLLGLVLSYFFLYLPYSQMLADVEDIDFGYKRALFGPLLLLLGLVYLVLGERAAALREKNWKTYLFAFVAIGIASLPYLWMNGQFTAHGYS